MKNLKEFKILYVNIKEEKKNIFKAFFIILISSIINLSYGYLNGAAVEAAINKNLIQALIFYLLYFLVSIIASTILFHYSSLLLKRIEAKLTTKLTEKVYMKVLDLKSKAFETKTSAELSKRICDDTDVISNTFDSLLEMVVNIFGSMLVLIYIFINSRIIGIQIILFMIVIYLVSKKYSHKIKKMNEEVKEKGDASYSLISESVRGAREVKSLGIKENIFTDIASLVKKLFEAKDDQRVYETKYEVTNDILRTIFEISVFVTCTLLLCLGEISITFYIAMTYYVYLYTWIINTFANLNKTFQKVLVSTIRINEILENRLFDDESFGDVEMTECKGVITFKNVMFGYENDKMVLNKLNVKFEPNKKIAIVGKSGQGKSTLFNLITRIYNPIKGKILIDGVELSSLTEDNLRKHISIVRQEPFIFNKTIKENFKLINPKITLKEIRQYALLAYLDDYIMSLPNKYDTMLGEGGINLSGGQKQRLAVARILAKKSKIILFDEATSSLDNESQMYIKKTIDNLVRDHTIIIVAHRLSTIKDADIIYVMDKGKISDKGSHNELIKRSKYYKNLYEKETE